MGCKKKINFFYVVLFLFALYVAYLHSFYKAIYTAVTGSNIKRQDSLETFVLEVKCLTV